MSYRNQTLPKPLRRPSSEEELRWSLVHGIALNCAHAGDNQGLCLDGGLILLLIELMGLHSRCRRLVVFEFADIREVFKSTQDTFGDVCTVIPNDKCKVKV